MANSTSELTDTQIKRAKIKDKEYNLSDGKGLQLRVKPSGLKVWLFNYTKPLSGKRTNFKIGEYPEVPLQKARNIRHKFRSQLSEGIDPQEYKLKQETVEKEANANTLLAVADAWFEIKSHEISEGYGVDLYNSLANHIFPAIGNTPIHMVKAKDVIQILEPLQLEGKLELVKRLCQRLNMIMDFAVIRGIVEVNPLGPISKAFKAPKKKHLPALMPSEIPRLVQSIETASITTITKNLMKWQLHTMVRSSEAAGSRWEEIDWVGMVWKIPASRMKKKRPHSVPLTDQAIHILRELEPISGNREYIFPSSRDPRSHASSATVNMALRRMGFKGQLVAHGFRSIASTALHEEGIDTELIEAALAHCDKNAVRAAYNRTDYVERRRAVMQWWSQLLSEAENDFQ